MTALNQLFRRVFIVILQKKKKKTGSAYLLHGFILSLLVWLGYCVLLSTPPKRDSALLHALTLLHKSGLYSLYFTLYLNSIYPFTYP